MNPNFADNKPAISTMSPNWANCRVTTSISKSFWFRTIFEADDLNDDLSGSAFRFNTKHLLAPSSAIIFWTSFESVLVLSGASANLTLGCTPFTKNNRVWANILKSEASSGSMKVKYKAFPFQLKESFGPVISIFCNAPAATWARMLVKCKGIDSDVVNTTVHDSVFSTVADGEPLGNPMCVLLKCWIGNAPNDLVFWVSPPTCVCEISTISCAIGTESFWGSNSLSGAFFFVKVW